MEKHLRVVPPVGLFLILMNTAWLITVFSFCLISQIYLFFADDPPKITKHPESQSVVTGALVAFTVEAMGDSLQFQWQKDGKDIDRDKSRLQCSQSDNISTLCIQHVEKSDQGHYKCLVTNAVEKNGKPSLEAELTVCELFFFLAFVLFFIAHVVLVVKFAICCLLEIELQQVWVGDSDA